MQKAREKIALRGFQPIRIGDGARSEGTRLSLYGIGDLLFHQRKRGTLLLLYLLPIGTNNHTSISFRLLLYLHILTSRFFNATVKVSISIPLIFHQIPLPVFGR